MVFFKPYLVLKFESFGGILKICSQIRDFKVKFLYIQLVFPAQPSPEMSS